MYEGKGENNDEDWSTEEMQKQTKLHLPESQRQRQSWSPLATDKVIGIRHRTDEVMPQSPKLSAAEWRFTGKSQCRI
jgi:hypothetical protein